MSRKSYTPSDTHRANLSAALKGKPKSPAHVEAIRAAQLRNAEAARLGKAMMAAQEALTKAAENGK